MSPVSVVIAGAAGPRPPPLPCGACALAAVVSTHMDTTAIIARFMKPPCDWRACPAAPREMPAGLNSALQRSRQQIEQRGPVALGRLAVVHHMSRDSEAVLRAFVRFERVIHPALAKSGLEAPPLPR